MSLIDITRNYEQGEALTEADLDAIQSSLTTFFNTTKIDDEVILDNSLNGDEKIIDNTITTAVLQDESITGAKFDALGITTAKIADSNVTTAKIEDLNVTTAKIADSNITTAKILDGSATLAKKKVPAVTISSSCGTYTRSTSSASAGEEQITNLSVSITATQGRVYLFLQPSGDTQGYLENSITSDATTSVLLEDGKTFYLYLYRDATLIYRWTQIERFAYIDAAQKYGIQMPLGYFSFMDTPSNGTYTYSLKADYPDTLPVAGNVTESVIKVVNATLVAVEL